MALWLASVFLAAQSHAQQTGKAVSGTFAPHGDGYFSDFQINYSVEGAIAESKEDLVQQVTGYRKYRLTGLAPGARQVRVSGTASGASMGGSSQYAGQIVVEVRVGDQEERKVFKIETNTHPPYSFDVAVPVNKARAGDLVQFNIQAGMLWPNGNFNISVGGSGNQVVTASSPPAAEGGETPTASDPAASPPIPLPLCSEAFDFFGDSAASFPRYGLQMGYDDLLEQMTRAVDDWETEKQGPKVFVSDGGEPVYAGLWMFSEGDPLEWMDSLPGQVGARIDLPARFSFSPNPRTEEGAAEIFEILVAFQKRFTSVGEQLSVTYSAPAGSEAALAFSIAAKSRAVGHRLDPGEVLQLALNSTGGDLRRATLLAHNTLKSLGRVGMAEVTGISPQKRFFDDYLAPIRETDNSGVWYHLFGTMYYQLETQNGVSLQTGARSMVAADAARVVYVPVTLARLAAQGFSTLDEFSGKAADGQSFVGRALDRTSGMLESMMRGGYSWDGTGWSGFANAAEQAYREIAGGRTPDPEKFCVNVWGGQLAQALWRRTGKEVPFQIVDSIRVNPLSNVAGDTMWIGGQDTGTVTEGDRLPSDPNDLMLPKLVFSGSPVDVMLEAEGVRLYFDQQAALMLADGDFPYPVQPYFAEDGYLGLMWLAPPVGPEPAVTFFGVADGDLHYAVVDPVAGEISTWSAPVRAGEELRWTPAEAPTGTTAADRAMLITGDGQEVAPQVVTLSFDGAGTPVTQGGFPVTLLMLGLAIAVGLVLIGVSMLRQNRASREEGKETFFFFGGNNMPNAQTTKAAEGVGMTPVVETPSRDCSRCGHALTLGARFCGGCGSRVDDLEPHPAVAAVGQRKKRPRRTAGAPVCPQCGRPMMEGMRFCSGCGVALPTEAPGSPPPLPQTKRFCHQCGQALSSNALFCNQCGAKTQP